MSGLDPRLKGLKVKDITMKFVQDNYRFEERDTVYKLPDEEVNEYVGSVEVVDLMMDQGPVRGLESALEAIKEYERLGANITYALGYEGEVLFTKNTTEPRALTGRPALQQVWKDELKAYLDEAKDLETYRRLKEKFGNE